MSAVNVGAVVVKDYGRLIGILTERDMLKAMAARVHTSDARVRQWMTEDPLTASPEMDVEEGASVIVEGAVEEHLFTVVRGRLRVHHGPRDVTVLGPGSTVGELAALLPEPRSADVTAMEPSTLLRIDKPVLDELLADRPALASGIIAALVGMVRERVRAQTDTTSV